MSTTTDKLALFKYDPSTDGAQTFNIKKALNDNWDKLDDAVKEILITLANNDPRKWGLGSELNSKYFSKPDDIAETGWYVCYMEGVTGSSVVHHIQRDSNFAVQEWYLQAANTSYGYNGYFRRTREYGVWGPIEWGNPPMLIGEEYRTTERYQGKPVYTMLVDFGSFPNSTQKDVAIPEKGFSAYNVCIDFTKSVVTYPNDPRTSILPFKNGITEISVNNACVRVTTSSDLSSASGYICVKYTK